MAEGKRRYALFANTRQLQTQFSWQDGLTCRPPHCYIRNVSGNSSVATIEEVGFDIDSSSRTHLPAVVARGTQFAARIPHRIQVAS